MLRNQALALDETAKAAFGGALATGAVAVPFNIVWVLNYVLNRLGIAPAVAKQDA